MLARERKAYLLTALDRDGRVVAKDIAAHLGVSEDSIRRDLRELAEVGACVRVYGGALPVRGVEPPVAERHAVAAASKRRVAQRAFELIGDGETVVLDGGTTALILIPLLRARRSLTVITPSPAVAIAVAEQTDARVQMIGGELTRQSMVNGGAAAVEAAAGVRADSFFMGASGVDPVAGLTTGTVIDAATKRALAERSERVFVFASEDKIGVVSRVPIIDLAAVTEILVDPLDENPILARLPQGGARARRDSIAELVLRRYESSDATATLGVFLRAIQVTAAHDYSPPQIEAWTAGIELDSWARRRAEAGTWVAVLGGVVVGFTDIDRSGYIDMMFVDPSAGRRGVARALLRHVRSIATADGTEELTVNASRTARPFFEREGFSVRAEQQVERNGVILTNYQMVSPIERA
jgi:DeoR/GlpR family transcriptional regulator of sugar metabolism/GNAT superfamily N-acetyltransferase